MNLIKIQGRSLMASALLFSTNLIWFFIFHTYLLDELLKNAGANTLFTSVGKLLFYSAAVVSGIVGSLISEKVERMRFLQFWTAFGFLTTASLVFLQATNFLLGLSILLGISFGLGFPAIQAFFTEATKIDSRGRIAGILAFISLIVIVGILLSVTFFQLSIVELIIICAILKAASLPALIGAHVVRSEGKKMPWGSILVSNGFASYAAPWLIFNIANGIIFFGKLPVSIGSVAVFGTVIEFFAAVFAALVGGFLSDRIGRKQPMMFGLVILGIGYALFGLLASPESYLIYSVVDGAAWGLLVVTYMQVILGDLASACNCASKERFFALGGIMIPFLTRSIFQVTQSFSGFTVPAEPLSTVLGICILISVIPVLRAPETLPESNMRERKFKMHLKKVGELKKEFEEAK